LDDGLSWEVIGQVLDIDHNTVRGLHERLNDKSYFGADQS